MNIDRGVWTSKLYGLSLVPSNLDLITGNYKTTVTRRTHMENFLKCAYKITVIFLYLKLFSNAVRVFFLLLF